MIVVTSISISRRWRHMWVEFDVGSLSVAPRGFSPGNPVFPSPQKPTLPNSNSIWNARTRLNEFIWTPKCFVGKQAIYIFFTPLLYGHPLVSVLERTDCTQRLTFRVSCYNWLLGIINNFGSIFLLLFLPQKRKLDPLKSFKYHKHQHKGNKVWVFLRFLNHFSFL